MILGIDPGSRFTGYAVISDKGSYVSSGVITLSKLPDFKSKLFALSQQLEGVISQYPINKMSLEKIFLGKNVDSAFKLGQVRGACLVSAGRHNIEVFEYAAKYVKKVVTGSGASQKIVVQDFINHHFNTKVLKEDESDALALAYCCYVQGGDRSLELNKLRI